MTDVVARKTRPETNLGLAGRVARQVELEWIRLRRVRMEVFTVDVDALPGELRFETSQRHRHRRTETGIDVFADYRLDVMNDAQGSEREVLVEAEFHLRYSSAKAFVASEPELRWFAELNGTLNAWPYWRELVQAVLGRAGVGSLTLPLWRAPAVPVSEDGEPIVIGGVAPEKDKLTPTRP